MALLTARRSNFETKPMKRFAHHACVVASVLLSVVVSGCFDSNREKGYSSREIEGIDGIEVVSAQVRIDLRPLANKEPAEVRATYRISNPNTEKDAEFFVVCQSKSITAQLNGVELTSVPGES